MIKLVKAKEANKTGGYFSWFSDTKLKYSITIHLDKVKF